MQPSRHPTVPTEKDRASDIPVGAAAQAIGVSDATIRNWIKTGYLTAGGKGTVTRASLRQFEREVAGKDKLKARANKQRKDRHDHASLSESIAAAEAGRLSGDELARWYEASLSESHRNKEGIYYTPRHIVEGMLGSISGDLTGKTFLDPCCGAGNFLLRALEIGFAPENIFGFDTDPNAVAIAKKRFAEKSGFVSSNIVSGDFLGMAAGLKEKFDFIFTNPPWGKKTEKKRRSDYARDFAAGKSRDTSALFFFAAMVALKSGGQLGLLLPGAFFTIGAFADARREALRYRIRSLTDYGKPFKKLMTRAQAIVLSKSDPGDENYQVVCTTEESRHTRSIRSFRETPKNIFNFHANADSAGVIERLFSLPHISLAGRAEWGLGIVTGNNPKYFRSKPGKGYIPVYRGSDILPGRLKAPSVFIPGDLERYQQVAPRALFEAPEKLIYRFIGSRLCFFCDTEQRYVLNSANLLVPGKDFPLTAAQLAGLFNSDFYNWLFQQVFATHKILRRDLETLPVHEAYFRDRPVFDEPSFLDYLGIEKTGSGGYRLAGVSAKPD